jgi:ABC-type Mn2+/Zn2+ transport system permease subunit
MDLLDYSFNQRALLTAIIIGFFSGSVGSFVVLRRAALFAGELSHTLFPGIVVASLIAGIVSPGVALIGAFLSSLFIASVSQSVSLNPRMDRNTSLAVFYTAFFGLGLLLLDYLPTYISLRDYLFGNILAVSSQDLWFAYGIAFVIISLLILFQRPIFISIASPEIAKSMGINILIIELCLTAATVGALVSSVQTIGTILSLGLLVGPAACLHLFLESPRQIFWCSGFLGASIAILSLILSNIWNMQTASLTVLLIGCIFILSLLFSPKYGFIQHYWSQCKKVLTQKGFND